MTDERDPRDGEKAKAVRPEKQTLQLTLTIQGHYEPSQLVDDWHPDHVYGPVERVSIRRDMHSANRGYDVIDATVNDVVPKEDLRALVAEWRDKAKAHGDIAKETNSWSAGMEAGMLRSCADELEELL